MPISPPEGARRFSPSTLPRHSLSVVLFAELPEVGELTCQHLMGCKVLRTEIMISFLQLWNISKHKNDLYATLLSR